MLVLTLFFCTVCKFEFYRTEKKNLAVAERLKFVQSDEPFLFGKDRCNFQISSILPSRLMIEKGEKTVKCLFRMNGKAKSSKSHKTPASSSSSSSSTTPSMTSSSLPVSTQAPVTSSHHSTSASSTPNSQTNVVRYERVYTLVKSMVFLPVFIISLFFFFF